MYFAFKVVLESILLILEIIDIFTAIWLQILTEQSSTH